MAHGIEIVNGVAQCAYAGETPWHGLGVPVDPNLTPIEMMNAAGLNWTVSKQPLFFNDASGAPVQTKQTALIRDSDNSILSYVPETWNPLQNSEAFEFFDEFVTAGEMQMHTAGSLLDGRRTWALANTKETFALRFGKQVDEIENFLLFSNPHEFGRTITVDMTSVRVVCNNTLTLALSKASANVVRISHKNEFDPEVVKETLFNAHENFMTYKERAEFLGSRKAKEEKIKDFFNVVFPGFSKKAKADNDNDDGLNSRNAKMAWELMETQPGATMGEGTWWQPFNAVTFMMDHKLGHSQENRINNVWFGQMRDRKVSALNEALKFAKAA